MSRTEIKPPVVLDLTEEIRTTARANCAARCRERGNKALAVSYELGEQDAGFAFKHEVYRLQAEQEVAS